MFHETRQQHGMKRFLVKSSMFALCLVGFLIHSYFKIRLFYYQQPITEYANERTNDPDEGELIKLPSFSVCFSGSLFRRPVDATTASLLMANNQRRSSLYYNAKQRLPPNVALLDDFEQPQFDDDIALRRRQIAAAATGRTNGQLHSPRFVNQMVSVDQAFGMVSKPRFSIKCDLIKPTKQRKLTRFTDNPLACEQIANVIESINYEADQKCYTFFSQLQQTPDVEEDDFLVYRSDLNGGDLVQIRIYFEDDLLALSKANQNRVHLLVHSNVEMPNFQQMKTYSLRSSHNYVVYFNQLTYKRENTNQSPCRLYKIEPKKALLSYLQQVPDVLLDYQVKMKNHLYKLLFSGSEPNATRVEDEDSQQHSGETEGKRETPKSQSDCVDKCHLETNRKYCICLPAGVNVRRELLSSSDLFCDELRCMQEDLPSAGTSTSSGTQQSSNIKNSNLKKDQLSSSASNEQLERLYTLSNGQFVSKRQERFKKCLAKNNCIPSCEEDRYDYSTNEKPDLHAIVQNILASLPGNASRHLRNTRKFARFNYYPDGYYYDPNYKQPTTPPPAAQPAAPKVENKRFSFKHQPEMASRNRPASNGSPNAPKEAGVPTTAKSSAFDDLGRTPFHRTNGSAQNETTRLSTSITVARRNQSSFTTSSVINRRTVSDQQQQPSFGQTNAISDNQLKSTTTTSTVETGSTASSIDPDSIDDNLENEDQADREYTRPSLGKYTLHGRKAFKFATSTLASANRNENVDRSVANASSSDEELLDDIPVDENVEERHNSIKPYQSLISIRNNRNGNRTYRERLSYSLIDLMFDLSLIAAVWLGFSVYLVADYFIYLVVLTCWHFVRLTFCLDWWFKKKHQRIVDSASSSSPLTKVDSGDLSEQPRSPKGSVSSQVSESRTFVKSVP